VPPPATPQPPAGAQPAPATEPAPAADSGGSSRLALLVVIVLGALVLALALILAIARWQGVEPPWWPRARHSLAEFGWRASGAWSDFADWVRLGR
jgi:heme A synthase